jgi:hypothetical protein
MEIWFADNAISTFFSQGSIPKFFRTNRNFLPNVFGTKN